MSQSISRAEIHTFSADNPEQDLGASVINFNWNFNLPRNTRLITIPLSLVSIAHGDPVSATFVKGMIQNLNVKFQDKNHVADFNGEEVIQIVQNCNWKEANEISLEGLTIMLLQPASIPAGTPVVIQLTVNTIDKCFDNEPTSAKIEAEVRTYDGLLSRNSGKMVFHEPAPNAPPTSGLAANTQVLSDLGNWARLQKYIIIRAENSAVATAGMIRYVEVLAQGNRVLKLSANEMKHHYRKLTDDQGANTGYYAIKFPLKGFQPAQSQQIILKIMPSATYANGQFKVWQIYENNIKTA